MEDNNVYVNIKLNTDGLKFGTKEVSDAVTRMSKNMERYGAAAQQSCDSAANAFIKQNQAVANANAEVDKLSAKIAEMKSEKVKTSFLTDEEEALKALEAEYSKLENKKLQMESSGKQGTQKYAETLDLMQQINREMETQKNLLKQLQNDPRSYTNADTTALEEKLAAAKQKQAAAINNASLAYQKFNNTLEQNKEKVEKTIQKAEKAASAAKSIKTSSIDLNKAFKKGLTTIIKYGFGIRSLYIAWRKLRQAMIDGFKTLAQEDSTMNKSISGVLTQLNTLKNSFAAAFAPIVNIVAPIIEGFIRKLNAMMQTLSQFIAMFTGQKTYKVATEVQQDYAKSLDKTGSAAKKATKYLSGLDEIKTFTPKDEASGGGGSKPAFEDKAIDNNLLKKYEKLKDLLDKIKKVAGKIKDLFLEGFKNGLGDWKSRVNNIKDNLELIRDALTDIFTDPRVVKSAEEMVKKIIFAFGQIVGAVASIGLTIAQNLVGGIAKFLDQNREYIKTKLIDMFNVEGEIWELMGNFAASFARVFEAFGGENGQQLTANIIGIFASAFFEVVTLAQKVGRDIIYFLTKPFTDNEEAIKTALDNTLGFLADISGVALKAVQDLGSGLNKVYDKHIKPFVNSVTKGVSEIVKMIVDYYNKEFKPVLDKVGKELTELYNTKFKPTVDNVLKALGDLFDMLKKLWEKILEPLYKKVVEVMLPGIKKAFESAWELIKSIITAFCDWLNLLSDVFSGAARVIIDLLNGDMDAAWNHFKETCRNVCEDVKQLFTDMVEVVKAKLQFLFDNSIVGKVYNGIKSITGESASYNGMPSNIPQFATGAVIPPNAPFLATLGDQKHGNNFEAPEGLLRQVVREEAGGNGQYQFTAQINRRVLFDEVINEAKLRRSASGRNPFSFA